jgi:pyridoxamine 5'-phosphate oxidase
MTRQEVLEFVNKARLIFLATAEGNVPYVRGVMSLRADEQGILFNTGKAKDLYRQLVANPAVEMCLFDAQTNVQVRISGTVEPREDMETKQAVLEKLPFLKPFVDAYGYDMLAPFVLKHGRATVWTMETNMEPKTFTEF